MGEPEEPEAPGWDAIEAACAQVYGAQEPRHWGAVIPWFLGGPDPLQGISAYDAGDHWHYVTYGFSDLYDKEGDDPQWSGYGFELTFRLTKTQAEPPVWCAGLLQNLARYVFKSGNVLQPGEKMGLNSPIALDHDTQLRSAMFIEDPQLGAIETPSGRVTFVQLVGVTDAEREAASTWDSRALLALAARTNPRWVTDLARPSWLDDPAFCAALEAGRAADGSSTAAEYVSQLAWALEGDRVVVTVGALVADRFPAVLQGRVPFGRPYTLTGPQVTVELQPGSSLSAREVAEGHLELRVPDELVHAIATTLEPVRGRYDFGRLTIEVEPTSIRDRHGDVVETVG